MCQSLDSPFPDHRGPSGPVPLQVDKASWSMHSRVPGTPAFQVFEEAMSRIIRVTRIVATVIA